MRGTYFRKEIRRRNDGWQWTILDKWDSPHGTGKDTTFRGAKKAALNYEKSVLLPRISELGMKQGGGLPARPPKFKSDPDRMRKIIRASYEANARR